MTEIIIPFPKSLSQKIADDALRYARFYGAKRGWRGVNQLKAYANDGIAALVDPSRKLKFVERGTKSFLMHWVEGRNVPILGKKTNNTYFVKGGNVGTPGYVTIPAGEKFRNQGQNFTTNPNGSVRIFRKERWRHPGISRSSFQKRSLDRSIEANREVIRNYMLSILRGGQ